jgi:hypothetical protein
VRDRPRHAFVTQIESGGPAPPRRRWYGFRMERVEPSMARIRSAVRRRSRGGRGELPASARRGRAAAALPEAR